MDYALLIWAACHEKPGKNLPVVSGNKYWVKDKCMEGNMGQEYIREGKRFLYEESGIGVVEIILILVVLVGLILIFKKQLTSLVSKTFTNINNKAGTL